MTITQEKIDALKLQFYERTGYHLDLENPRTYCEKIQWRKVYDRNPIMPIAAEKIASKIIVEATIGKEYNVPTMYKTYIPPRIEEVNRYMVNECVIKANHGCAWMIFQGLDGEYLDAEEVKQKTDLWMSSSYGAEKLQWADSEILSGIIVEKMMTYKCEQPPLVKIYTFDGIAEFGNVIHHEKHTLTKRGKPATLDFYDEAVDWFPAKLGHIPTAEQPAPQEYMECMHLSEKLSQALEVDHVRVDWLITDDGPRFSEFTWYPTSGMFRLEPIEYDRIIGDMWTLRK